MSVLKGIRDKTEKENIITEAESEIVLKVNTDVDDGMIPSNNKSNEKSPVIKNSILGGMLKKTVPEKEEQYKDEVVTKVKEINSIDETSNIYRRYNNRNSETLNVGVDAKMRKLFNIHLPILSGYLNKEFKYIPEDFTFLYSDDFIYYGEGITRLPTGLQLMDLMLEVLIDILGFNNLWINVYNNKQMSIKYRSIICHKLYEMSGIYIQNILKYHGNSFGIPREVSEKTLSKILETSNESYLPASLIRNSVYSYYRKILMQVGEQFNISTKTFNMPAIVTLSVTERATQHSFNLTTNLPDLSKEYYPQRLERYRSYESKDESSNEVNKNNSMNENQENNDNNSSDSDSIEETLEKMNNKLTELNENIEKNFSKQEGKKEPPIFVKVNSEPTQEWKMRLKEWINYHRPKKINSYMTPNKKLLYTGMILSSRSGAKGARDLRGVCIYIDTSTSIDLEKINKALGTLRSILEGYKGDVKIKTFTTDVVELDVTLNSLRNGKVRLNLGGGTDIQAVLKDVENSRLKDYINIVITDGELDWEIVEGMKKNNYKTAYLITKPIDVTNLPKGRNIKIYEVS